MRIEIKIDETCREPRVVIVTDRMTEAVSAIAKRLSEAPPQMLSGFREGVLEILEPGDILRVYASGGKVYAATLRGAYLLRPRLYEVEERLAREQFVRISNSEIVNLRHAKGFDLSLTGTICVKLSDGTAAYVSRRYVSKIKQVLGI